MKENRHSIHPAASCDVGALYELIQELAAYEGLSDSVSAREVDIRDALFGPSPVIGALIAWDETEAVGFATYYMTYSTFRGKPGLYVEDLFVRVSARGHGIGRALMAHLAGVAKQRGCHRMTWAVLDWNEPAINFYTSLGAERVVDWLPFSLAGEALTRL